MEPARKIRNGLKEWDTRVSPLLLRLSSRKLRGALDGAQSRPLTSQSNQDQSRTSRVWSGEEEKLLSAQRSGHQDLWEGIKRRAGLLIEGSRLTGEGPVPPGWSAAAAGIPLVTAHQPAPPKTGRDDWEHYASAKRPACSTITPWITSNSIVDRVSGRCTQTPYTRVMWMLHWTTPEKWSKSKPAEEKVSLLPVIWTFLSFLWS